MNPTTNNSTESSARNSFFIKTPSKNSLAKYPAEHFITKEDNKALVELIEQNSLATLLYLDDDNELQISHIPFHFNENPLLTIKQRQNESLVGYDLMGHVSNDHPIARQLKNSQSGNITLIFHGEEDYISPNDVSIENRVKQNVPTWNYAKVHVQGSVAEITDMDKKYQQMSKTSHYFEQTAVSQHLTEHTPETPWSFEAVPKRAIEGMFKAITLFTVTITGIEGRFKLSQNKPTEIREQIAKHVTKRNKATLAKMIHSN
jgi:transcriptional regulator